MATSGLWIDDGFGDVIVLQAMSTDSVDPSDEAQAAYGDSRGPVVQTMALPHTSAEWS